MNEPLKGKLYPLRHHATQLLIRGFATSLVMAGAIAIILAFFAEKMGFKWGGSSIGSLLILGGWWVDRQRPKWMAERPARCPNCGGVMDTIYMVWEEADFDNSPWHYTEYRCRSCHLKCTNDFVGKFFYGWPPKAAYEEVCRKPPRISDVLTALVAIFVMLGVIALLYWFGWVGQRV
ncbi:MAG: hypothetical protein WAW10_01535 [Gallionella sp.]